MRKITPNIVAGEIGKPAHQGTSPRKHSITLSTSKVGPGPSKLRYRLSRAWAKPIMRNTALVYLPLVVLAVAGWRVAAHDQWRGLIEAKVSQIIEQIIARPEFAVRGVAVMGGSSDLQATVRKTLAVEPGMPSMKLDVEKLRLRVEAIGAVEAATVQFDPQGTLRVAVVERIAAALFRQTDGVLVMLDDGGVEIGPAGPRANYPALPVILGAGAQDRVGEVIALIEAAPGIVPRLRAFVSVGERRWDVILDRDMLIKLPAEGSVEALSRIMALHHSEDLLDRDIAVIDMRLPERPALRMMPEAAEIYQIRKAIAAMGGEDT